MIFKLLRASHEYDIEMTETGLTSLDPDLNVVDASRLMKEFEAGDPEALHLVNRLGELVAEQAELAALPLEHGPATKAVELRAVLVAQERAA